MAQGIFTQEERDVIIKLVTDVKINVLDQNAVPLVSILQSIAKKVFALSQANTPPQINTPGANVLVSEPTVQVSVESSVARTVSKKPGKKALASHGSVEEPDPLSF